MNYQCETCHKKCFERLSHYNRKKHHFCSQTCYTKWQLEKRTKQEHPRWEGGVTPEEARRRWYQKNKKKMAMMAKERRLRESGAYGSHTEAEWQAKLKLFNNKCAYDDGSCWGPMTKDHITPLIMGGSDDIDNIVPACKSHNSRKWKKVALDFS